ncbi:MAG: biopolymer transporter ExbD [Myxococcota bacterium]
MAKGKRGEQAEDLDLVPIMNLVTILIPFLLMASSFVSLAVINSTLPAIGQEQEVEEDTDEPPLSLKVAVTDEGFVVQGNDELLKGDGETKGVVIDCKQTGCPGAEAYDVAELRELLIKVKDVNEDEENVILVPESTIPYEVLVMTMDATREDPETKGDGGLPRQLFPGVVIAGGMQ